MDPCVKLFVAPVTIIFNYRTTVSLLLLAYILCGIFIIINVDIGSAVGLF